MVGLLHRIVLIRGAIGVFVEDRRPRIREPGRVPVHRHVAKPSGLGLQSTRLPSQLMISPSLEVYGVLARLTVSKATADCNEH